MAEPAWTPQFVDGTEIRMRDGIYRGLTAKRAQEIEPLLLHYRRVRAVDGYRHSGAEYYRSLPYVDRRDAESATWRVRQQSFGNLRRVLKRPGRRRLRILDLGAGNGWLSHRLALDGHACVAVDWLDDQEDGLAAARHSPVGFTCLQADFDDLPLASQQFDVAIFNASLHYSTDPSATLRRARTSLVAGGMLVVMDSPVFTSDEDGRGMLDGQEAKFRAMGAGDVRWGVGYLTTSGLARAAIDAGVRVRWIPSRGWPGWALKRWVAGLEQRRPPARFGLWFGIWQQAF
jgi:2-polyprenyl-3-methyl-5-hydroxy-6-metoxy-1,4-benzoquinol methylase